MSSAVLGKRLLSAVKYVRRGAVFADIGTDHAYLPIYLLEKNLIERAVLSDINKGPLSSARENAEAAGVTDRVELVLCDGASKLSGKNITDAAIFGMGGELISEIIEAAPFIKTDRVRLILQPMSKQKELCDYLLSNGFTIIGETYTKDSGKFYRTISAEFCGTDKQYENFSIIGLQSTPCEEIKAKIGYLSVHLASCERAALGKKKALIDASSDEEEIKIIKSELKRLGANLEEL